MLPWRPLGMLTFGLTIIFLFIRLHGDGYDFPVRVAKCDDTLDHKKPSRTFLEVSGVYHDTYWDWPQEQDQDGSIAPPPPLSTASVSQGSSSSSPSSERAASWSENADPSRQQQYGEGQGHGRKFTVNWPLGKKKLHGVDEVEKDRSSDRDGDRPQEDHQQNNDAHGTSQDSFVNDIEQWLWMTNVWLEDGDSGSGYLRQYRRRLDHVMASDASSSWDLMYTHRFPGIITHTSLSKRIIPEPVTRVEEDFAQDEQQPASPPPLPRGRELIRLAIVYKVVQEEQVSYHARIYHLGIFQHHAELRECEPFAAGTCHRHAPFLYFDYVLPGSSPIKDFTLEHDMIYYSRLYDTAEFRRLKLPLLKEGATTPERPYLLNSGAPGPTLVNKNKKAMQYRQSFLTKLPSVTGRDPQVLVGQVNMFQLHRFWLYQTTIATETTEAMTGHKKWLTNDGWYYEFHLPYQETDLNDETATYGVPIQTPYFIKSSDGSSIHLPIANIIESIEMIQPAVQRTDPTREKNSQNVDRSSSSNPSFHGDRPQKVAPRGANYYEQHRHHQEQRESNPQHNADERIQPKGPSKSRYRITSKIDLGALDSISTELGTINDSNDILALKTTLNGVMILKRTTFNTHKGFEYTPWSISMIMSDDKYSSGEVDMKEREVIAMKIVTLPAPASSQAVTEIKSEAESNADPRFVQNELDSSATVDSESEPGHDNRRGTTTSESDDHVEPLGPHNILLMVFGDGRITGYDLDQVMESSSVLMFLQKKYPAVIGMLVVVATFVFNEARYAIALP